MLAQKQIRIKSLLFKDRQRSIYYVLFNYIIIIMNREALKSVKEFEATPAPRESNGREQYLHYAIEIKI